MLRNKRQTNPPKNRSNIPARSHQTQRVPSWLTHGNALLCSMQDVWNGSGQMRMADNEGARPRFSRWSAAALYGFWSRRCGGMKCQLGVYRRLCSKNGTI